MVKLIDLSGLLRIIIWDWIWLINIFSVSNLMSCEETFAGKF
jgi:hypothetical protein